jgi:hypothetical protein
MNNPCDVKILYDTEFEAEIAASKSSYALGAEMIHYRCGTHWHVANKEKKNRSKYRKHHQTWCEACNTYMKASRYKGHLTRVGHQRNVYKMEKKKDSV